MDPAYKAVTPGFRGASHGSPVPSPAQLPFDGARLGPVRRGVPGAGRRLPIECEVVRAGRPTSPGPPRSTCRTQTRWTIRRFEPRHGSGCSTKAPIRCFIRHHTPIPTSVPGQSPVAGLGDDARAGGGDGSGVLVLRIGVPPRRGLGREPAARTAQPIELSLRSPQITPPGVMPGWCAGRPGAATSMTRRTAPGAAAHIFPVASLRLPRCHVSAVTAGRAEERSS